MSDPRKPAPRVLIVEDDPFTLEAAAEALADSAEVLAVATAEIALAAVELCAAALDAIVVDVDLGSPFLTGFDLARRARELNPLIEVVFATGRAGDDLDGAVPGAVHVGKPYCAAQLARRVAQLTARPLDSAYVAWSTAA